MTAPLDTALRYAARGLPVFPLWPPLPFKESFICSCGKALRCKSPAKHPISALARHGVKDATTDEKVIRNWWASRADANIAIATGAVIVVDVDPRHGGDRSLAELERTHDRLPPTWRVRTGGGGIHIYFAAPPNTSISNSASKLGDGLDVRGAGGYVVAPNSRHISGQQYEWTAADRDPAVLPTWVIAALQKKPTTPASDWRAIVRDGVSEGKRNDAVARLAGHLLRHFVDPRVTLELLLTWNAARCVPPLAPDEVARTVNSIAGLEMKRRNAS